MVLEDNVHHFQVLSSQLWPFCSYTHNEQLSSLWSMLAISVVSQMNDSVQARTAGHQPVFPSICLYKVRPQLWKPP